MGGWTIRIARKKSAPKLHVVAPEKHETSWKTLPVQCDVEIILAQKNCPIPPISTSLLQHHLPEEVQNVPP